MARVCVVVVCLLLTGCACHTVKPDPPIHVSRCHPVIDGINGCAEHNIQAATVCQCTVAA